MPTPNAEALTRIGHLTEELDATLYRIATLAGRVDTDDRGRARHNDPAKAELSRELLRGKDLAQLIESEMGVIYWRFKGYQDPREEVTREQADRPVGQG